MVKEAQANMGILLAEQLQLFQKDQTQGIFAGADGNQTMLQLSVLADFLLADGQLLKSQGNVFIKLAAFRCKCDSFVGAEKERTFQLPRRPFLRFLSQMLLQFLHPTRTHIRLSWSSG